MNRNLALLFIWLIVFKIPAAKAQENLMDLFGDDEPTIDFAYATFKSTRVVYGHSVENPAERNLIFLIQHNFGRLNSGIYELFGLDQATIDLVWNMVSTTSLWWVLGAAAGKKTYDGFLKIKLLRQSSGARNMPISISYMGSTVINTLRWANPDRDNFFSSRMAYVNQLLIARKFSDALSLQLSPTIIHKNLVPTKADENTSFAVGVGGRYKLNARVSINAEYYHFPASQTTLEQTDALSVGFDIETGGHVFQLHISNANAMFERAFVTETTGKWNKGDLYFGFNISRNFVF